MGLVSEVVGRKCRRSAERWEEAVSPKSSQFFHILHLQQSQACLAASFCFNRIHLAGQR